MHRAPTHPASPSTAHQTPASLPVDSRHLILYRFDRPIAARDHPPAPVMQRQQKLSQVVDTPAFLLRLDHRRPLLLTAVAAPSSIPEPAKHMRSENPSKSRRHRVRPQLRSSRPHGIISVPLFLARSACEGKNNPMPMHPPLPPFPKLLPPQSPQASHPSLHPRHRPRHPPVLNHRLKPGFPRQTLQRRITTRSLDK